MRKPDSTGIAAVTVPIGSYVCFAPPHGTIILAPNGPAALYQRNGQPTRMVMSYKDKDTLLLSCRLTDGKRIEAEVPHRLPLNSDNVMFFAPDHIHVWLSETVH